MTKYSKAIAATLSALATWIVASTIDGVVSQAEWWALLGVVAAALATYLVENKPDETAHPAAGPDAPLNP